MGGIRIDPRTRIARTEAGVAWLDVVEAAARHGLATLAGSSPDTGVTGSILGEGISLLGRTFGLAANSVSAIEVVTAGGRDRHLRFHLYDRIAPSARIDDLLREIDRDPAAIFWG